MHRTLAKLKAAHPVTIVARGDSNTELTWHTRDRLNWVGLLDQALFQTYGCNVVTMINAGLCGDTASRACSRLDRDVLRFDPDLVIVALGMNDAGGGPEALGAYAEGIRTIVRRCREHSDAELLLRTSNPIVAIHQPDLPPDAAPGRPWPGTHQGLYARRLVELAGELDCAVVDHYTLWVEKDYSPYEHEDPNSLSLRMSDTIHPGPAGHMAFFRELAPLFDVPTIFCWEQ